MCDEEIHCVINYLLTAWSLCLPSVWERGKYDHQKRLNFLAKWQRWKKIDWFGFALIYLKVQFWVIHHQFGFIGDRSERIEPGRAAGEHLSIWAFEHLSIWAFDSNDLNKHESIKRMKISGPSIKENPLNWFLCKVYNAPSAIDS